MAPIKKLSPVAFNIPPAGTETRDRWTVALSYPDDDCGTCLIDLSHLAKWDLQGHDLSVFTALGAGDPRAARRKLSVGRFADQSPQPGSGRPVESGGRSSGATGTSGLYGDHRRPLPSGPDRGRGLRNAGADHASGHLSSGPAGAVSDSGADFSYPLPDRGAEQGRPAHGFVRLLPRVRAGHGRRRFESRSVPGGKARR